MRFNATLNVDFAQWKSVKMERDLTLQNNRQIEEEMPKFGAGSEYNRDLKEELRRKRFGINPKKFKPEAQPWVLKTGKNGKKFRGIREGGVGENAAFYVFTHAPDKAIEAYPLHEWYNFQPIQRYKSLSAEEAEHEFGRRKKVINYFSLMLRKRLKGDEADDGLDDVGDDKKLGKGKAKELKISDMDEWIDSDDDDASSTSSKEGNKGSDNEEGGSKKKKGKKADEEAKKKKKKKDVDDEAFEESDDGDEEGRELDYISDSSDAVSDLETQVDKQMQGVAEEDALRKLLTSDEDSDEEREKSNDEEEDKEEQEKESREPNKDKKKKGKRTTIKGDKKDSSSDFSTDSDSDIEQDKKTSKKKDSTGNSRSTSPGPESLKRKAAVSSLPSDLTSPDSSNSPGSTPVKKPKLDAVSLPPSFTGVVSSINKEDYGITEEAVRRYLARKPMTTTELLTKFKNKKTGVSSDKLVDTMTQILKRINPVRQTIMGKMYLSIKVDK